MFRIQVYIFRILFSLLMSSTIVSSIRCYECENGVNPACGKYFKAYQFKAKKCGDGSHPFYKCALQRQTESDGWVGIARVCYEMGTLYGLNETDGCREWTNDIGFTALYCFCSTNFCNNGVNLSSDMLLLLASTLTLLFFSSSTSMNQHTVTLWCYSVVSLFQSIFAHNVDFNDFGKKRLC